MDRHSRVLSVQVDSGPSVTFTRIDPEAVPFVNLHGEDDAVEIISAQQVIKQISTFFLHLVHTRRFVYFNVGNWGGGRAGGQPDQSVRCLTVACPGAGGAEEIEQGKQEKSRAGAEAREQGYGEGAAAACERERPGNRG